MILPEDTKNLTKASQVEYVEPFLWLRVGSPGLVFIQKRADHTGVIDGNLGFRGQLRVVSYSRNETAKDFTVFLNLMSSSAFRERLSVTVDPRVEVVDNFQLCIVNEDGGRRWRA